MLGGERKVNKIIKSDEARAHQSKWADGTPCWCECILYKGHRCGACHNAFDAKVRIMKAPSEMTNKIKNQSTLSKCEMYVRTFC